MAAANDASVVTGGVHRFTPPYSVDEYIHKYFGRLDARRFAILPAMLTLTVFISVLNVGRRTGLVASFKALGWSSC